MRLALTFSIQLQQMSVNQGQTLSTQIKTFIQLLQNKPVPPQPHRKISNDSDPLSIIYSASEPESTIPDKQPLQQLCLNSVPPLLHSLMDRLSEQFSLLKSSKLAAEQLGIVLNVQAILSMLRDTIGEQQDKIVGLEIQYERSRANNQEILRAIAEMDETENELWRNYKELQTKYGKMEKDYDTIREQNESMSRKLVQNQKDIQFMKKLVLVANQNYEKMQRKCRNLQLQNRMLQSFKQQHTSPNLTSRSTIYHKKSQFSPSISQKSDLSHKKAESDQNYRRLVLRTLKNKAVR